MEPSSVSSSSAPVYSHTPADTPSTPATSEEVRALKAQIGDIVKSCVSARKRILEDEF